MKIGELAARAGCDGDPAHGCAILESFGVAAGEQACACHAVQAVHL